MQTYSPASRLLETRISSFSDGQQISSLLFRVFTGVGIGFLVGSIISIFRISTSFAFTHVLDFTAGPDRPFYIVIVWLLLALGAGLAVGRIARDPAMRFGGADWINHALADGQPHVWRKILIPKFIGSWLVMACCISVGREGPCIQMGAATAEGIKHFDARNAIERRHYILAGCSAGLAAAFSAPFAGICYVYEIMRQKLDTPLFIFLLSGGFGVFLACTQVFGLGVMLPCGKTPMPGLSWLWTLLPLACFSGLVGISYNYLLRLSIKAYSSQKLVPVIYRPLFAFVGAAFIVLFFPAITGEGLTVFSQITHGQAGMSYLCIFLLAKLLFTAFCYGSFIPAGLMVPVICLGGVAGGIYADCLQSLALLPPGCETSFIVMGMAGSFAAAERAPVTALVLIAEMTGTWSLAAVMLPVAAITAFMARLANVRAV